MKKDDGKVFKDGLISYLLVKVDERRLCTMYVETRDGVAGKGVILQVLILLLKHIRK